MYERIGEKERMKRMKAKNGKKVRLEGATGSVLKWPMG